MKTEKDIRLELERFKKKNEKINKLPKEELRKNQQKAMKVGGMKLANNLIIETLKFVLDERDDLRNIYEVLE